ncbi:MAG: trypsin-like peptidase domain-containing protein [Bacteroidetes bacterium]|nr:trypsin-like peptidase domain-containing protein [Bacteroidota bacterium]
MKKIIAFAIAAFALTHADAQETVAAPVADTDGLYIDYQQYLGDGLGKEIMTGKGRSPVSPVQLHDSAALLRDEGRPGYEVATALPGKRVLHDEDIYAGKKKSVYVIGKLKKRNKQTGAVNFDLIGTAFAISADGVCVTNWHVLREIMGRTDPVSVTDSVYFIETVDKKLYFIEKVLAYSLNNDLAVFKVNTLGGRLQPLALGRPARVGAAVYCISHPQANFYYFSKGIVARNLAIASQLAADGSYNREGRLPIRMEITADYAAGSSGGPLLDKFGNVTGIVCSTRTVGEKAQTTAGTDMYFQQMVIKQAIPVQALIWLLRK